MTNTPAPVFARGGHARLARDVIPASHRDLPMVRVLLPMWRGDGAEPVRWSEFVTLDEELASLDWREAVERHTGEHPDIRDLESCRGVLDPATAAALADAVGEAEMSSLRWAGYAGASRTRDSVRVYGDDYVAGTLRRADLRAGERAPEFAWDEGGTLAWGARLYPDSLVVAGDVSRLRRFHADPRIDTVVIRPDSDELPPSAGD